MRNKEVIENFIAGRVGSGGNLTSADGKLYSYQTCIAEYTRKGLIINKTKYSVTTSKHVGMLLKRLCNYKTLNFVEGVPKGSKKLWTETNDN